MTFIPAKVVIANLREKIEKLKDKIKAIENLVEELDQPNPFTKGKHNNWLDRLRKTLEDNQSIATRTNE